MNRVTMIAKRGSLLGATLVFSASLFAAAPVLAQAPDNTKQNQGDAIAGASTADHQMIIPADRNTTKLIRSAIM